MARETDNPNVHALASRNPKRLPCPMCENGELILLPSPGRGFSDHRLAALALLIENYPMSRKAGQFLGQLVVDQSPLTPPQADWLAKLLDRAGLPLLAKEGME